MLDYTLPAEKLAELRGAHRATHDTREADPPLTQSLEAQHAIHAILHVGLALLHSLRGPEPH
jgi:hypothetical protein